MTIDFRLFFSYASAMESPAKPLDGALLVAACIVAAIRLRGQEIRPSPKLTSTVQESVALARLVLREIRRGA